MTSDPTPAKQPQSSRKKLIIGASITAAVAALAIAAGLSPKDEHNAVVEAAAANKVETTDAPATTPTVPAKTEAPEVTTAPAEAPETTPPPTEAPTEAPSTTELVCSPPEIKLTSVHCGLPPTTTAPAATAAPAAPAAPAILATYHVSHVIDGDTLDVVSPDGATVRVRVIGVDTPEHNQCGFTAAAHAMTALVDGKDVTLTAGARDDVDKYGRLLRYVDVDSIDAGKLMIESGLAIARYDSRDGYGKHTREDDYLVADYVSANNPACSAPAAPVPATRPAARSTPVPAPGQPAPPSSPAPGPPPAAPTNSGCEPAYPTVCIPRGPDLDCGEISFRRFVVNPPDPFRFDADGDGLGCESD